MSDKIAIVNQLKKDLRKVFGDKIQKVILFGSSVRNEETEFSDLDVLIVTNDILSWKEKSIVRDICYDIHKVWKLLRQINIILAQIL